MISLRYGFLCDYAGITDRGSPIAIGIFDVIGTNAPPGVLQLPLHYIHLRLEALGLSATAPRRLLTLRLVDADGHMLIEYESGISFAVRADGLGAFANVNFGVNAPVKVPDHGMYTWVVLVDGTRVGELPLSVHRLDQSAVKT